MRKMDCMAAKPEEMRKRVRAALGYAGLSQTALEEKVKLSRSSVYRRSKGDYSFESGELFEIAEACNVPLWFLKYGWEGWRGNATGQPEDAGEPGSTPEDLIPPEDLPDDAEDEAERS